jgi:hypothetical protein
MEIEAEIQTKRSENEQTEGVGKRGKDSTGNVFKPYAEATEKS